MYARLGLLALVLVWTAIIAGVFLANITKFNLSKAIASNFQETPFHRFHEVQGILFGSVLLIGLSTHPKPLAELEYCLLAMILLVQLFSLYPKIKKASTRKKRSDVFARHAYNMLELVKLVILLSIALTLAPLHF